jgi:hypothetical protein
MFILENEKVKLEGEQAKWFRSLSLAFSQSLRTCTTVKDFQRCIIELNIILELTEVKNYCFSYAIPITLHDY